MNGTHLALVAATGLAGVSFMHHLKSGSRSRLSEVTRLIGQPVREIGHGAFSRAYSTLDDKTVFVVVKENVWDKEILAAAHEEKPRNPHIPAVRFVDALHDGRRVYRMPRYDTPLTTKKSEAWVLFRALRDTHRLVDQNLHWDERHNMWLGYEIMDRLIQNLKGKVPKALLGALVEIKDQSADYGSTWWWEFAPRNLATDPKGRLVLLDPIYDRETLRKIRGGK